MQACQYYDKEDGNYLDEKSLVYIPDQLTLDEIEDSLFDIKVAQGQAYLASLINNTAIPTCVEAFTRLPCKSLCDNVINLCGVIPPSNYNQDNPLHHILSSPLYPKDCSGIISNEPPLNVVYPTGTTSSASSSSCNNQAPLLGNNQLILKPRCFPPSIIDEYYLATNIPTHEKFCVGGCCVKCPQTYSVYPDGWLEKGFMVTQSFRVVSAVLALIMSISYILLPGKRTHPGLLILFTSIAIFIFSSLVFFSIGDPKKIQCVNDIDPSTQSNNILCAIQGALIIFASFATTMWVGIIIVNLHIHTVWSSNCVGKRYIILHLLGWGIPAFFTVIALATSSVNYEFATLCFIKEENASRAFFYPLAVIVIPIFFIHMATFFHIARMSQRPTISRSEDNSNNDNSGGNDTNSNKKNSIHLKRSNIVLTRADRRDVLQAVKIQWRALLLSIILVLTVIFYWIFYFIELNRIASGPDNSDFKDKWIQCIQSGNGQDNCYYEVSLDRMPPYGLLMLVELLPSLIGIWLFVIFANGPLWIEWKIYLKEKLGNKRKTEVPGLFFDI
nr:8148_t:CDS:2 [Entrophospora candida]